MISKEQLQELEFGQIVYVCTGPGDFPEQGLCAYQGEIVAKVETRFGLNIEVVVRESRYEEIAVGSTKDIHTVHKVGEMAGIGAYINA